MNEVIDDFLEHHGVKGMKWGVRKQDSTGALRQKKPRVLSTEAKRKEQIISKAKKKGKDSLTNKELADLNKRLQMEQQFSRHVNVDPAAKRAIQAGLLFVSGVALTAVKDVVKNHLTQQVKTSLTKKAVNEVVRKSPHVPPF